MAAPNSLATLMNPLPEQAHPVSIAGRQIGEEFVK